MMFKRKGGGGVKGLLTNVKKTALFLHDGFPKRDKKRERPNDKNAEWEEEERMTRNRMIKLLQQILIPTYGLN